RLVLSAPLPDKSLRERFQEYQANGLTGIPRGELLAYLRCAADGLDWLHQEHGLHHLMLNPRNLLVQSSGLRIADFGLAQLLWLPAGQDVSLVSARYAAPELAQRQISLASDQYSLALIYYDLLAGGSRRSGMLRRSAGGRRRESLDMGRLPPEDRPIIARALDPVPSQRWENCLALVQALESGVMPEPAPSVAADAPAEPLPPTSVEPPAGASLETTFRSNLPRGVLRLRFEGFPRQRPGPLLHT